MLEQRCKLLRSLHVPGTPVLLPNAWDAASARVVVVAGFPVVASTSAGVAAALGYDDHEAAPAEAMFAAAARMARSVDVPVTIDAESGYGLSPDDLVTRLLDIGAAGCNLEDTDHSTGTLVPTDRHAARLAAIRQAASSRGYGLVINARIDVFLAEAGSRPQGQLVEDGVARANAYLAAGVDCVYPILLHDERAIASFLGAVEGPVNILALPGAPPRTRLAELRVARISYGSLIYTRAMQELGTLLADIASA